MPEDGFLSAHEARLGAGIPQEPNGVIDPLRVIDSSAHRAAPISALADAGRPFARPFPMLVMRLSSLVVVLANSAGRPPRAPPRETSGHWAGQAAGCQKMVRRFVMCRTPFRLHIVCICTVWHIGRVCASSNPGGHLIRCQSLPTNDTYIVRPSPFRFAAVLNARPCSAPYALSAGDTTWPL